MVVHLPLHLLDGLGDCMDLLLHGCLCLGRICQLVEMFLHLLFCDLVSHTVGCIVGIGGAGTDAFYDLFDDGICIMETNVGDGASATLFDCF